MANFYLTRNPSVSQGESNVLNPGKATFPVLNLSYTGTGAQDFIFLPDPAGPYAIQIALASTGTWTIEGTNTTGSVVNGTVSGTAVWTAMTTVSGASLTSQTTSQMVMIQGAVAVRINIAANATGITFNLRAA